MPNLLDLTDCSVCGQFVPEGARNFVLGECYCGDCLRTVRALKRESRPNVFFGNTHPGFVPHVAPKPFEYHSPIQRPTPLGRFLEGHGLIGPCEAEMERRRHLPQHRW